MHVRETGDIHIDDHHTNEDVALAIGTVCHCPLSSLFFSIVFFSWFSVSYIDYFVIPTPFLIFFCKWTIKHQSSVLFCFCIYEFIFLGNENLPLQALGDRKGINRFCDFPAPLDEALIHVSLVSSAPSCHVNISMQLLTKKRSSLYTSLKVYTTTCSATL